MGVDSNVPTIAVVIPNWNDARYLPRCLASVLHQQVPPDQVIVVDDCSTDDSVEVIRDCIAGHPQAELVASEVNRGTYGAVDEGLKRVRSDYVLFLAANDFVLDGIFARAKDCLARAPGVGVWSAMAWLVDEADAPIRLHASPVVALRDAVFDPRQSIDLAMRFGSWFTGTTLIYHRRALEEIGRFDAAYGGLADLISALVMASRHGAAYTPAPYAVVRLHAGSYLSNTLKDVARLEGMLDRLGERGPTLSPELFTPAFLQRTALRLRFAGARAAGGATLLELSHRMPGWRGAALRIASRTLPAFLRLPRIAAAFVILRPFDILPTLVNRMAAWAVVRARIALRRAGARD